MRHLSILRGGGEARLRLKPIEKDRGAFLKVIYEKINEFNGYSKIIENYKLFLRKLRDALRSGYTLESIYNAFMRLNVVIIGLDGSDKENDPQVVFESINATGLHLDGVDLIRNFLMMGEDSTKQAFLFETYWQKIESTLVQEKNISAFILHYLRIYFGANVKNDEIEIYKTFKKVCQTQFKNDKESMMQDMLKFAQNYAVLTISNARHYLSNPYSIPSFDIDKLYHKLRLFQGLGFSITYPMLMGFIDDFHAKRLEFSDFCEIVDMLIAYLVRRSVCELKPNKNVLPNGRLILRSISTAQDEATGQSSSQNPNNDSSQSHQIITAQVMAKFLGTRMSQERLPTDIEIESKFSELNADKLKTITEFVLRQIEYSSNEAQPKSVEIESVFPLKPTQNWLENLSQEVQSQIQQVYVYTFGNLTLLEQGKKMHKRVDNSPQEKLQFLSESSHLHLNSYFSALDCFDLDSIKARSKYLCKQFLEIFSDIPQEFRSKKEAHTLETNWTHLRPTSTILPSGEVKSTNTSKKVAKEVISYLLEHYKEKLYEVMINLDFIKDSTEKKSYEKVGSGFVYEDFGEFAFICKAEIEIIRKNLKLLVEGINNEECKASDFEIEGYYND